MQTRTFRAVFGARQILQLAPALCVIVVLVGLYLFGDRTRFAQMGSALGMMAALWMGFGLWSTLGEVYQVGEGGLVIISGPKRVRISYDRLLRVTAGDVMLPSNLLAKGALLIEQEGAKGMLIYPRQLPAMVAELKLQAPGVQYVTSEAELAALRAQRAKESI
jgi:hypothetical protein